MRGPLEDQLGVIGGTLGIRLLNYASRGGTVSAYPAVATAYAHRSKLEVLFGPEVWDSVRGKEVLDFGCGEGNEAVDVALHGARRVIGLDLYDKWLNASARLAEAKGVTDKCVFGREWSEPVDVILSVDSFEHFADPADILERMRGLLKSDGCVLASFGPTWYHPLGGHFFSVFPYAHLLCSESALVRWRSLYKKDGARSFTESGLNRMTIRRFEKLVAASPFRFAWFEAVPIRRLRPLANRLTREFTTAVVRCRLVPRR
jgi:SAM-dependent methyltransferase